MKKTVYALSVATLVLALVSCGKAATEAPKPPAEKTNLATNPTGEWEYEYLTADDGFKKYKMVVLKDTLQLNGVTYFKVEPTERDTSLRAMRIEADASKIDWVIAGDAAKPDALTVESNTIAKSEQKFFVNSFVLEDSDGDDFAKITKK